MRRDGSRVKGLPGLIEVGPYFMPRRCDSLNSITEYVDEEVINQFLREKRRNGVRLNHMAVMITAYYRATLKNPKLNYFIVNRKIYKRNHFCVSFVLLKIMPDGNADETILKIYLEPEDTVYSVSKKIEDAIAENRAQEASNNMDHFIKVLLRVPGLPKFAYWSVCQLDKFGLLPKKLLDLSPFHASLFITNLASIKTGCITHHNYEFGTTSVFMCMGRPTADFTKGNFNKKVIPLGITMDDRICAGYEYVRFNSDLRRYLRRPELLEVLPDEESSFSH